jgi:hypothetical protein
VTFSALLHCRAGGFKCTTAKAQTIHLKVIGELDFTGTFTNDFTNETFGTQTVQNATGLFAPYVSAGDTLGMDNSMPFGGYSWNIGYTLNYYAIDVSESNGITLDFLGIGQLSGNGFDPASQPFGSVTYWEFFAPNVIQGLWFHSRQSRETKLHEIYTFTIPEFVVSPLLCFKS